MTIDARIRDIAIHHETVAIILAYDRTADRWRGHASLEDLRGFVTHPCETASSALDAVEADLFWIEHGFDRSEKPRG